MPVRCLPVYQDIDGVKYSLGYQADCVRDALNYTPRDGDIVMVSHLKCGNNWLAQIIQLILHRGQSAKDVTEFRRRTSYIEFVGTGRLKSMTAPRFYKTHFSYERQPMNPKAKYVYLTRNPLDVCVSLYHFTRSMPVYEFEDGTLDAFFELFVTGKNDRGDFFNHLLSWYDHKNDSNVFIITYEELKGDFKSTVLRLARFLGKDYEQQLTSDKELFEKVQEQSGLPFMTKLLEFTQENMRRLEENKETDICQAVKRFVCDRNGNLSFTNLVRKGVVGDWKTLLHQEHLDRLRRRVLEKKAAPVLKDLWKPEDLGYIV
ncbi:hypothetical protein HPB47_007949 [Ixodes persulcatus]|uniref:Uncharacterized protein n=1 Tax=Ixodes persulcatus TaxID=34615 RepID=A0AC60P6A9_IXOPE|nr:hypothetical protein HPB47_007949 [Ixodes persulcatus]